VFLLELFSWQSTYCKCKACDLLSAARKSFSFSRQIPTVFLKFNVTSGKRNYICQRLGPRSPRWRLLTDTIRRRVSHSCLFPRAFTQRRTWHWQSRHKKMKKVVTLRQSVINSWNSETAVQLLCTHIQYLQRGNRLGELLYWGANRQRGSASA
jgi:hypothetical protein